MKVDDHDGYIAKAPEAAKERLAAVRALVHELVPDATEHIGYGMMAFRRKKVFFYVGAFKRHLGVYPPVVDDAEVVELTARWRGPKGNLTLPYDETLPMTELERVVRALAAQYA